MQPDNVELVRRDYVANGGWETFLAYEDPEQDILVGYHAWSTESCLITVSPVLI